MVARHEYSDTYDGKQKWFCEEVGIQCPKTRNNGQKYQTSDSPSLTLERRRVKILTLILHSAIFVLQDGVLTWLEMTYCHTPVIRYFLHVSPSIVGRAYVAKIYTLTIIGKVFV